MLFAITPDVWLTGFPYGGDVWFPAYDVSDISNSSSTNASTWAKLHLPPECVMMAPAGLLPPSVHSGGRPPLMVNLYGAYLTLVGGGDYRESDSEGDGPDYATRNEIREYVATSMATAAIDGVWIKDDATLEQIDSALESLTLARTRRQYMDTASQRVRARQHAAKTKKSISSYRVA